MGKVGIPVLCYNLGAGGARTDWVPVRGGAVSSQFDYAASNKEPPAEEVQTEEELWDHLTWLLERIIPVAEEIVQYRLTGSWPKYLRCARGNFARQAHTCHTAERTLWQAAATARPGTQR